MGKFFNVEVKPTILASKLATVYGSGDVVFDWHAIDVPKGASKLMGVTAIMRQKHGTAGNEIPFQLVYAKSININSMVHTIKNIKTIGLTFLLSHESDFKSASQRDVIFFSISTS